jgi:RIO-like serine/threonine protein kinase
MGICVPTVIGLYNAAGGRLSLAMELPHPIGWREADPHISVELKEKVIVAYQNIHGRNILHNDVKLENVLIGVSEILLRILIVASPSSHVGDDDEVTIVDFCKMVIDPEPADLALEMRAVKFILDYDGAKKAEYERLRRAESRVERTSGNPGFVGKSRARSLLMK